jgi:hypothetical protein
MFRPILFAAGAALLAASPSIATAAPCKDAHGKFTKCPAAKPVAKRCRLNGKFAKCGTPGAKAV